MIARSRTIRSVAGFLLVIASCAALVAGCGSGTSKGDYETKMAAVMTDLDKASSAVSNMKPDAAPAQRAEIIRQQGSLLAKAADKADAIEPPSDAKSAHDQFVTALRGYAKLLGKLADASSSGKATQQQAAILGDMQPYLDKMNKAGTTLNKAGYKFRTSTKK